MTLRRKKYKNLVFDLDGTLIDSSKGITESLAHACFKIDGKTRIIDKTIIGPPVHEMISLVASDFSKLEKMEALKIFRKIYDNHLWEKFSAYKGVYKTLEKLYREKFSMHIATNKPHIPTSKICEKIGIVNYFESIRSLDTNIHNSKFDFLKDFIKVRNQTVFIGDTHSDLIVASKLGIDFIYFESGFDKCFYGHVKYKIKKFENILRYLYD